MDLKELEKTQLLGGIGGESVKYEAADSIAGTGVTLTATANMPTGGYRAFFRAIYLPNAADDSDPVGFELRLVVPTGIVNQLVTPIEAKTAVTNRKGGELVTVWDAHGVHMITIAVS